MSATSPLPRSPAVRHAVPIRRSGTAPRLGRQLERLGVDAATLRVGPGQDPAAGRSLSTLSTQSTQSTLSSLSSLSTVAVLLSLLLVLLALALFVVAG